MVRRRCPHEGKRYLQSHLGIRPGDLYNEALVAAVDKRIRELPFVSQKQRPYLLFTPEQTKLYLFLDTKKASSFNGILGVLPDPVTGQVKLTGDLDLRLRNALKRGEAIDLNWRALQDRTQDLKARTNYPFAFNTPFGVDLSIKLFKRDTTFLEVASRAALEYLLSRGDKVSVFVNNKSSERLGRTSFPHTRTGRCRNHLLRPRRSARTVRLPVQSAARIRALLRRFSRAQAQYHRHLGDAEGALVYTYTTSSWR